jgi:hypothetical protein
MTDNPSLNDELLDDIDQAYRDAWKNEFNSVWAQVTGAGRILPCHMLNYEHGTELLRQVHAALKQRATAMLKPMAAPVLKPADVFCLLGMWGTVTDPGMYQLTTRLTGQGGINVHASPYRDYALQDIVNAIMAQPEQFLAIFGSSLGANNAPDVAQDLIGHRTIDFMVGFQPSQYGTHVPIPVNVKHALCFFNPVWIITAGLGNYQWVLAPDNDGTIVVQDTKGKWTTQRTGKGGTFLQVIENLDLHPADFDTALQDIALNEMQALRAK